MKADKIIPVIVARLSGRTYRDLRITTHCALVARAFGAQKIVLDQDQSMEIQKTVEKINQSFGGKFEVEYTPRPVNEITRLKKDGWEVVHLTMYGETPRAVIPAIRKKNKKVLVVIGADNVQGEIYQLADYNISITRQPHSEVGALAVFLHELNQGREEEIEWKGAAKKVIPQKRGKKVLHANEFK